MAPPRLFETVKGYVKGNAGREPLPALSTTTAVAISIAYASSYVLPFYFFRQTRPSPTLSRDAPSIIRTRIRCVAASCLLCSLSTAYVLRTFAHKPVSVILSQLGWYPISIADTFSCLLLTSILFSGPLFERAVVERRWRQWIQGEELYETLSSWIGWRNFIAGPITEEVLFRSVTLPVYLLTSASASPRTLLLAVPLIFGVAHIHHFYEFTLTHPHTPLLPAVIRTLFQFSFTTLFGWYANYLYLRTGSIYAVILCHTFCNWLGLPRVWGKVEAGEVIGPAGREKGRSPDHGEKRDRVQVAGANVAIGWTIAYYVILVAGAVGFWKSLKVLTSSEGALAKL